VAELYISFFVPFSSVHLGVGYRDSGPFSSVPPPLVHRLQLHSMALGRTQRLEVCTCANTRYNVYVGGEPSPPQL
jgi:hypothetical protein